MGQETLTVSTSWLWERTGTAEVWKRCVVLLMTQRSQVKILTPATQ